MSGRTALLMVATLAVSLGWTGIATAQCEGTLGAEEAKQLFGTTPEQERTAARLLGPNNRREASAIADLLRQGRPSSEVQPRWEALTRKAAAEGQDVCALVHFVLREGYAEQIADLKHYAEEVRYINATKKLISEELDRARSALAAERSGRVVYVLNPELLPPATARRTALPETLTTAAQLRDAIKELEERDQKVSTQFEHLDKMTNETMNTISRVLRTLNEMRGLGAASRGGL